MRLAVHARTLRLARPLHASYGVVAERELLSVSVTGPEGASGRGEAAPLRQYEGASAPRVRQALARYERVLREQGPKPRAALLEACRAADALPAALAAVDTALWDREAHLRGVPLATLLCPRAAGTVTVNATLAGTDPGEAAEQAAAASAQGYRCVKVKVALAQDRERVGAVREAAGEAMELRLDANGGWTPARAAAAIGELAHARPQLFEEPVHGLAALRALRARVDVRVAIDETAAEPGALDAGVADAVCLKLSRCGGITGLLAAARRVRASGAEVYVASTLEGPVGIAAALHAAAALRAGGPLGACGLATLGLFQNIGDPLPVRDGEIALPPGAGLGIDWP